eukprot:COSAG06_NODE_40114_length_405_cov_0.954248_2_plen_40_part_01
MLAVVSDPASALNCSALHCSALVQTNRTAAYFEYPSTVAI